MGWAEFRSFGRGERVCVCVECVRLCDVCACVRACACVEGVECGWVCAKCAYVSVCVRACVRVCVRVCV